VEEARDGARWDPPAPGALAKEVAAALLNRRCRHRLGHGSTLSVCHAYVRTTSVVFMLFAFQPPAQTCSGDIKTSLHCPW